MRSFHVESGPPYFAKFTLNCHSLFQTWLPSSVHFAAAKRNRNRTTLQEHRTRHFVHGIDVIFAFILRWIRNNDKELIAANSVDGTVFEVTADHGTSILEMLMLSAFTNRNKSYLLALSCRLISLFSCVILLFVVLLSRVFSILMTVSHLLNNLFTIWRNSYIFNLTCS